MEAVFGSDSDSESFVDDDWGIRKAAGVEGGEPEDEGEKPKDTDDAGEQSTDGTVGENKTTKDCGRGQ